MIYIVKGVGVDGWGWEEREEVVVVGDMQMQLTWVCCSMISDTQTAYPLTLVLSPCAAGRPAIAGVTAATPLALAAFAVSAAAAAIAPSK